MNDSQLGDWMRSLPRTNASPDFTSGVLRKVHAAEVPRRTPLVWRMTAAAVILFCLTFVTHIAVERQKLATLRAEQQRLQADLQAVKKIANDAPPVVVLENDNGTRVIIDLEESRNSAIQPASLKTYD